MLNLYIGQKQEWLNKNGCKDKVFYGQNKNSNRRDMIETTKRITSCSGSKLTYSKY